MPIRYYSTASAAALVGCGRATINRAIADGRLAAEDMSNPGSKKPRYRIKETDLERFRARWEVLREVPVEASA